MTAGNRIPTFFVGEHVTPGRYTQHINHYTVLRTILAMYGLTPLAKAANEVPIGGIWNFDTKHGPEAAAASITNVSLR